MSKNTILVVDDEPKNVKFLSAFLKADGFSPVAAYNGEDAIDLAVTKCPDVILLDVMMPDMNGFEVAERLKAIENTKHIPIVLVTSLDGANNRTKGLNFGADEFLTKPVNRAELLARVRALQHLKRMQEELENRRHIIANLYDAETSDSERLTNVLLVEDDDLLCRQIVRVLADVKLKCITIPNASVAREYIKRHQPDLILLDRVLPDEDGIRLMEEIKSMEYYVDVPIIVVTALDDLKLKIAGIEKGADDYLIKPVDNSELQARVRAGMRRAYAIRKLRKDLEQAQSSTVTDKLTGVRNRYYLDADLNYRVATANRSQDNLLSCLMVDIDFFKGINDEFGHIIGDKALCGVAEQLVNTARASDIVTRFGGEEFCVVLPDTDLDEAVVVAERVRSNIEQKVFPFLDGKRITVSVGVAQYDIPDQTVEVFLSRVDELLYAAKTQGRNCVVSITGDTIANENGKPGSP